MLEKCTKEDIGINDSFIQKYWLRSLKQGNRVIFANVFCNKLLHESLEHKRFTITIVINIGINKKNSVSTKF